MLPTTTSKGRGAARAAPPLFGPYLRRIVKVGAGLPFVLLPFGIRIIRPDLFAVAVVLLLRAS
jgi:hypothetical protein